jgi:hypothetical protein
MRPAAPVGVEEPALAEASLVLSGEPLLVADGVLSLPEAEAELPESVASWVVRLPHSLSRAWLHWNWAAASEPVAAMHWSYQ